MNPLGNLWVVSVDDPLVSCIYLLGDRDGLALKLKELQVGLKILRAEVLEFPRTRPLVRAPVSDSVPS